ncbi:MAG: glycosyl hydrolase [Bacteroidota bacterium]
MTVVLKNALLILVIGLLATPSFAQKRKKKKQQAQAAANITSTVDAKMYSGLKFRNIGPFRGGRSVAVSGVRGNPMLYYMGSTGGGIWKTEDAGVSWKNISDGQLKTGSVGAIAVAPSDPNIIYVGMGEHPVRGVMTSFGDGVYKSTNAGKTWKNVGLPLSRHIAAVRIHPENSDVVYVAVQGAVHGPTTDRGVYKTMDGGTTWKKIFFVDENTGAADLSMDTNNPRILYAGMWDHRRLPWTVRSGGPGSGIYKSVDGGENWEKLTKGLPEEMGKVAVDVSPANSNVVFANIESHPDKAGVYRSDDGGKTWKHTTKDRVTIARAWYYTEIFAHPTNENTVYVLNAPVLKSIDGGKSFKRVAIGHTDQHDVWINPDNPNNMIVANDGGATISFNGGKTWSTQENQPTVQFYRVITDNQFPYRIYGGQQDNSTVSIASRAIGGIGWKDWYPVAGGESAFLAFDPDNPEKVYGGTYHGIMSVWDAKTRKSKDIMAHPVIGLGMVPKDMKYRFNWNSPIVASPQDPSVMYHGGNKVLKTTDGGQSWTEISPDLTRNEKDKQGLGGVPFTIEGAGGENYNTISYLATSTHSDQVLWAGSDCGLVHVTQDGGQNWTNVTPPNVGEAIINAIDVSLHDPATAYLAVTKYKFNDFTPMAYVTKDFGKTWTKITNGFDKDHFVRVVREDPKQVGLLYAGTEGGLYLSNDQGKSWQPFSLNLPVTPITDLTFRDNDLVIATSGRGFWILDDLGAIQQSKGTITEAKMLHLFSPKPAVKATFSGRSGGENLGKNPLNGVSIDYFLPEKLDSTTLTLTVFDEKGNEIRTYSSEKDKNFKKYEGGPSPAKVLPTKQGVNRFVWDFRRNSVPAIPNVFVNGSYAGSSVAPGKYRLRLSDGTNQSEASVTILPDPRLDAQPADFAAQQLLLGQIDVALLDIHQSVNAMRKVQSQLKSQQEILEENPDAKPLLAKSEAVIAALKDWESQLIQPKQKTFQDVINFPNQLNSHFMNLKSKIDSHDPRPTKGVQMRLKELLSEWEASKNTLTHIIDKEIATYNQMYRNLEVPALVVPEK